MDAKYVARYGPGPYDAADACVLTDDGYVLLILRDDGTWAFPGGFLNPGERPLNAAVRELREETGLEFLTSDCERGVFRGSKDRDPRAWIRTHAYLFHTVKLLQVHPMDDANDALWFNTVDLPVMYADHKSILEELMGRVSPREL